MPFDKLKFPDELMKERRKGVCESLQTISVDELKKIAKEHEEEFVDDPWRDEFLRLIAERPQASFYRAVPDKEVVVYYCHDADFGVWVLTGCGMGPLDANGKRIMKEAIEGSLSGKSGGKNENPAQ
jgi:hypothetical protein